MRKKKGRIRLCPKCKKPKLRTATNVSGWLAPNLFRCDECGYVGALYIEIDPNEILSQKKKEEESKKKKE